MKKYYEDFGKNIMVNFIKIPLEQINKIEFWIKRFTPSVKVTSRTKSDYKITIRKSQKNHYSEIFNHTIMLGKIDGNEGSIGKYVSQVFQKLLIEKKIIYVHGACVCKGDIGVIIIGDFGQGKSSVALECTLQDKNVNLLSDNGIAIIGDKIIGQVNSIALRNANTTMMNKINKEIKVTCDNMTYFDHESKNIEQLNIKSIIIPHINAEDNNIYNVDKEKSKWYLYNKLTSLLRGETLLFNGEIPSKSFANKKKLNIILNEVNYLIDNIPLKYVSCKFDGIIQEVLGDLNERK